MRRLALLLLLLSACAPGARRGSGSRSAHQAPQAGKTGLGLYAVDDRLVVSRVQKGSPAQRAGVRERDRLLKVSGKPVAKIQEALQLLKGPAGTRVRLSLERSGKEFEVVFERF